MSALQDILKTRLVDTADVARALDTTPRSVARWQHDGHGPHREKNIWRMLELKAVLDLAVQVMPAESAALWLRSPVPELGYNKPLDLIRDGEFRRVIDALTALAEGVCT
jgi:putative toxin-antitoxin system antitoxin component (TIGR02293 family)